MAKAKKDSVVTGGEPGRTPLPHILQDAGIQFKGISVLIPDPKNARDNVTSDSRTLVPQDNSGDSQNALSQATQNYGWKNENDFAPVRVTDVGAAMGSPSPVPYPIAESVQTTSQLPDMLYFREYRRLTLEANKAYAMCDGLLASADAAGRKSGLEDQDPDYQEKKAWANEYGQLDSILQERAHAMLNHAWGDPEPGNAVVEGF